ncbi:helix-turn-helix domain-containing protein [Streptomyces rimosus]|uniref:helix-turn-helix domain-containing protein n=1 Tax=Streptomyces rimosus TaxID=1927 RepID=UPI00099D5C18|nr:AraC family transcriptional regulator [Streptomyces rimosus]
MSLTSLPGRTDSALGTGGIHDVHPAHDTDKHPAGGGESAPPAFGAALPEVLRPAPARAGSGIRSADPAYVHPSQPLGFLRVSTVRGPARPSFRASAPAGIGPYLLLGLHASGRAVLVRRESAEACRPGDLFVCDGAEPLVLQASQDFTLHLVWIPRRALPLTDHQARALSDRAPFADGPVAPLLGPLLRELIRAVPQYAPRTALHLAGTVAELVALLAAEEAGPGPQDGAQGRRDLVRRLRAYVDAHLWDRGLTPASVAAAQHISIRYLHKLFESGGSTVGRWIRHRRLEEARRELARPGRDDTTVAAVAARWGFAGAAHFSRSFRAAYGMSPSDWRDIRAARPAPASSGAAD